MGGKSAKKKSPSDLASGRVSGPAIFAGVGAEIAKEPKLTSDHSKYYNLLFVSYFLDCKKIKNC